MSTLALTYPQLGLGECVCVCENSRPLELSFLSTTGAPETYFGQGGGAQGLPAQPRPLLMLFCVCT